MPRGRSQSPHRAAAAASRARSRSRGPGGSGGGGDRARSRSVNRQGRSMSPNRGSNAMRGKRPQSQDPSRNRNGQQPHPNGHRRKYAPKRVRKVGKHTKKGIKKVGKYGAKPVKKFQNTNLGKRIAPPEKCGTGKICSYFLAFCLLLASIIGLVIATGNAQALKDIVNAVAPDFDLGNLDDPFAGGGTLGVWAVKEPKNGLTMEILNALDDSWQTIFQLAIADWDFGSPDALTLSTTPVAQDPDCSPVNGKVKVCNGDYGEQPWRGIAVCMVGGNGNYQNCACKMNDYYLKNGGDDLRQYTMCHEVGHGFGLPHTDEDFNNADLGNCLDYTENFAFSKSPDASNYQKLAEFYGVVDGGRRRQQGHLRSQVDDTAAAAVGSVSSPLSSSTATNSMDSSTIPESVWQRREQALAELEIGDYRQFHSGWRRLHQTKHGQEHVLDLGMGYKLQVQMLLHTTE
eukprot:scaffold1901_cov126-Cylindrotheca_fusiformis.AAC.4